MDLEVLIYIVLISCSVAPVLSLPADKYIGGEGTGPSRAPRLRSLWKRFIDTSSSIGGINHSGIDKIRTKRSSEDCEQLQLCRLHARSSTSFLAAFQLYFVNKENARLWDHRARSAADCERRFSCDR